ncbi:MAG: hypothetical protein J7J44_07490 [Deltaproteobacteria bacterium]|nr:hypothetical protein [Deltaproteobacteria bacterium]
MPEELYLIVTIDVEEDNWEPTRQNITCENVKEILKINHLFKDYNIKPTYLLTYPVAMNPKAISIFQRLLLKGDCEIGAHLHPWNTPPFKEELISKNTFLNNLPGELIIEKLQTLTNVIEQKIGVKPKAFRSGRWGISENIIKALILCNYKIDTSITPFTLWEENKGESNRWKENFQPFWISSHILEVPVTIGFNRWPFARYYAIHESIRKSPLKWLRLIGWAHHIGLLKKIWLTPELYSAADMLQLTKLLVSHKKNIINFTFHSNSLLPGLTPFVKTQKRLNDFYEQINIFFASIHKSFDVKSITLSETLYARRISLNSD